MPEVEFTETLAWALIAGVAAFALAARRLPGMAAGVLALGVGAAAKLVLLELV